MNSAFSSYKDTGKNSWEELAEKGIWCIKNLFKNNIIVQKAGKGNTDAILNRKDYVCKMKNIVNKNFI